MNSFRPIPGLLFLLAAAVAAAPEARAQDAAPRRAAPRSWTSDRRDFAVGDVVTVLVDESTVASANKGSYASETRSRDLELGASGTGLAASLPATGARVGTGSAGESRQRGEATRATRFTGELSARVDSVGAGGLLRIRGRKVVDVDRNREEIAFTGWVRPQDVSRDNTVDSWRVADAELVYTGKGSLGKPRTGILGRILGMVWP